MSPRSPHDGPRRLIQRPATMSPEDAQAWFRAVLGPITLPTPAADAPADDPQRERRRDAVQSLVRALPAAYRGARFGSPELAARVGAAAAQGLADTIWRCPRLVFMGNAGAGKTTLAVACLRRWSAEAGRAGSFFHAYGLGIARIQHAAGNGEPEIVDRAMKCPLALLDDLGAESTTATSAVPDVILVRHAEERPLWVTTGLTRAQIAQRYGAGIVRRIFERARVIELTAAASK